VVAGEAVLKFLHVGVAERPLLDGIKDATGLLHLPMVAAVGGDEVAAEVEVEATLAEVLPEAAREQREVVRVEDVKAHEVLLGYHSGSTWWTTCNGYILNTGHLQLV
jgi:hypothetical protein